MDDASAYEYSEQPNIRILDGYLQYYFHIPHPEKLTDDQWCEKIQTLHFIRKSEEESTKQAT